MTDAGLDGGVDGGVDGGTGPPVVLPPSPVTIAVIIVIAIVVFLPVSEETPPELRELQDELAGLGADVLAAAGPERTARISNLLRRMRGEQVGP